MCTSGSLKIVPIETRIDCRQNGSWHRSPRIIASTPNPAASRIKEPTLSALAISGQISSVSRAASRGTTVIDRRPPFRLPHASTPEWNFTPAISFISALWNDVDRRPLADQRRQFRLAPIGQQHRLDFKVAVEQSPQQMLALGDEQVALPFERSVFDVAVMRNPRIVQRCNAMNVHGRASRSSAVTGK